MKFPTLRLNRFHNSLDLLKGCICLSRRSTTPAWFFLNPKSPVRCARKYQNTSTSTQLKVRVKKILPPPVQGLHPKIWTSHSEHLSRIRKSRLLRFHNRLDITGTHLKLRRHQSDILLTSVPFPIRHLNLS